MTRTSQNYRYFRRHFNSLVKRHGGRMVVIAKGRLVGSSPHSNPNRLLRLIGSVKQNDPKEVPFVTPVPTVKELANPLLLFL